LPRPDAQPILCDAWSVQEAFASQLAEIEDRIDNELRLAIATLPTIAEAITGHDPDLTKTIAQTARELKQASHRADAELVIVAARQAPVARDLRLVLALVQLAQHQGLLANQFELITEQLAEIDPAYPDGQRTSERLAEMAMLAASQLEAAVTAFESRDLVLARRIEHDDDEIDRLNREVFQATLDLDGYPSHRELTYRHVLIARSLERIGDNAVDIAEQAAFLETAEMRQFTDASHPHKRLEHDS
jgi:phosphate transport system protein